MGWVWVGFWGGLINMSFVGIITMGEPCLLLYVSQQKKTKNDEPKNESEERKKLKTTIKKHKRFCGPRSDRSIGRRWCVLAFVYMSYGSIIS